MALPNQSAEVESRGPGPGAQAPSERAELAYAFCAALFVVVLVLTNVIGTKLFVLFEGGGSSAFDVVAGCDGVRGASRGGRPGAEPLGAVGKRVRIQWGVSSALPLPQTATATTETYTLHDLCEPNLVALRGWEEPGSQHHATIDYGDATELWYRVGTYE